MQLIDGTPVYSATDLVAHLACEQLTALERAVLGGLTRAPFRRDPELDVLTRRGFEHEQRYLRELRVEGKRIVSIEPDGSIGDYAARLIQAAKATRAAMRLDLLVTGQERSCGHDTGGSPPAQRAEFPRQYRRWHAHCGHARGA